MANKLASGWMVIRPKWTNYTHSSGPHKGHKELNGLTIAAVYQKRPPKSSLKPGDLLVEVQLGIDESIFYPQVAVVAGNITPTSTTVVLNVDTADLQVIDPTPVNAGGKALQRKKPTT